MQMQKHAYPTSNVIDEERWEQSWTKTSMHMTFVFCSLVMAILEACTIHNCNIIKDYFEKMQLHVVCENDIKNVVNILLDALSQHIVDSLSNYDGIYCDVQEEEDYPLKNTFFINSEHLEDNPLYLHKYIRTKLDENTDMNIHMNIHLLVMCPTNVSTMVPMSKDFNIDYTVLTCMYDGSEDEQIFPPMTLPPCFTGVVITLEAESTLNINYSIPKVEIEPLMKVKKYGEIDCICGTNTEYENDVIHSHYIIDTDENDDIDEEQSFYRTKYFCDVILQSSSISIDRPLCAGSDDVAMSEQEQTDSFSKNQQKNEDDATMHVRPKKKLLFGARSKYMNDVHEDCLGCRIVVRLIRKTILYDKKRKSKNMEELDTHLVQKMSKITV